MPLRSHQRDMLAIVREIRAGRPITDIFASVTPGAGKSWLPVIAARELIPAIADKICWVVPRKNLAAQAEDAFAANPGLQALLPHAHLVRAAGNQPDPSRGLSGYVVTYQAIGVDNKGIHEGEFSRHRYILVLDEPHHIGDEAQWPERLAPLVKKAALRIFMSGTFERHDRQKIAFIPYMKTADGEVPDLDGDGSSASAKIVYTRGQAITEGSIANLIFRRHDATGLAWETPEGEQKAYDSFESVTGRDAKAALWTALRRQYALDLLAKGIANWREFKQTHSWARLLIVAHGQAQAEELQQHLVEQGIRAGVAISNDTPEAVRSIDRFKGRKRPPLDALVTVQMAYEGMDVPQISHVVCLTGIRSKPWLEQCFARAARVFPGKTQGYIWVPNDPLFRHVYEQIIAEQGAAVYGNRPASDIDPLNRKEGQEGASGLTPLDAAVGAETNSDLTGRTLTAEETALFAAVSDAAGLQGLAPIEVKRLLSEGATSAAELSAEQLLRLRDEFNLRRAQPSVPVVRPSDEEREYRDRIAGWLRHHAFSRVPGETPQAKARRAVYLREINTTLAQVFGPRDRLTSTRLKTLFTYVQRYYP